MPSRISLVLVALLATPALAQQPPAGEGPRATSGDGSSAPRYDAVGYAGVGDVGGLSAVSAALPADSFAEVTSIDTGKVIVVVVVPGTPDRGHLIDLSPTAAAALGIQGARPGVRIRPITVSPSDIAPLRAGQLAADRGVVPPPLLAALRRKLSVVPRPTAPTSMATPRQTPLPKPLRTAPPATKPTVATPVVAKPAPGKGSYVVQVATLSVAARAQALAAKIGGTVTQLGALYRVQSVRLSDQAAATRERARLTALGYADARIVRIDP